MSKEKLIVASVLCATSDFSAMDAMKLPERSSSVDDIRNSNVVSKKSINKTDIQDSIDELNFENDDDYFSFSSDDEKNEHSDDVQNLNNNLDTIGFFIEKGSDGKLRLNFEYDYRLSSSNPYKFFQNPFDDSEYHTDSGPKYCGYGSSQKKSGTDDSKNCLKGSDDGIKISSDVFVAPEYRVDLSVRFED